MHGYSHWNETPVLLVSQASIDDGYHLLSTDYLIGAPPSYNVNRLSRFFEPPRTPDRTDLFHHYRVQYPRGPPDIIYLPSQGLNDDELARESRQLEYQVCRPLYAGAHHTDRAASFSCCPPSISNKLGRRSSRRGGVQISIQAAFTITVVGQKSLEIP